MAIPLRCSSFTMAAPTLPVAPVIKISDIDEAYIKSALVKMASWIDSVHACPAERLG